jgi:hypothetical protein
LRTLSLTEVVQMNYYFVVQLLIQCILNVTEHNLRRMYCYRVHWCCGNNRDFNGEESDSNLGYWPSCFPERIIHSNRVNMSKAVSVLIIAHYHLSLLLDTTRSSHSIEVSFVCQVLCSKVSSSWLSP